MGKFTCSQLVSNSSFRHKVIYGPKKDEKKHQKETAQRILLLSRAKLQPGTEPLETRRTAHSKRPGHAQRPGTKIQPVGVRSFPEGSAQRPRNQKTLSYLGRRGCRRRTSDQLYAGAEPDTHEEVRVGEADERPAGVTKSPGRGI